MDVVIIKARAVDAAAVWRIRNSAILAQCRGYYSDASLAEWTAGDISEDFTSAVADRWHLLFADGSAAAAGVVDCGRGRIDAMFVSPEYLARGRGRTLLCYLENRAVAAGVTKLSLDATLNAVAFYRKCGFTDVTMGTNCSPRGISLSCVHMEKVLQPAQVSWPL